jgi:hypothetical protein
MAGILWWYTTKMSQSLDWSVHNRLLTLAMLISGAVVGYFGGLWLTGLRVNHLQLENA